MVIKFGKYGNFEASEHVLILMVNRAVESKLSSSENFFPQLKLELNMNKWKVVKQETPVST